MLTLLASFSEVKNDTRIQDTNILVSNMLHWQS